MLFEKITLIDGNYEEKRDMYLETEGNRIVYIGTERPEGYTGETYDGRNKVALPGFYNIHCHIPDTLLRGYGEGLPLHRWLTEKMFPFEAKLTEATAGRAVLHRSETVYYGLAEGELVLFEK